MPHEGWRVRTAQLLSATISVALVACGGTSRDGSAGAGAGGGNAGTQGSAGGALSTGGHGGEVMAAGSGGVISGRGGAGGGTNSAGGGAGKNGLGADDGGPLDGAAGGRGDTGADDAGASPGIDRGCGPGSASGISNAADPARADAEQRGIAALERLVGQFVGGSAGVYRGTLKAHDNESVFGQGYTDRDIPLGPAIADVEPGNDGGLGLSQGGILSIYSPAAKEYVRLEQVANDPRTTNLYMLLNYDSSGGKFGPCVNCAPIFANLPPSIVVSNASGTDSDVGLTITVSTTLTIVSPCSVTFADVQTLNFPTAFDGFASKGDELVSQLAGRYSAPGSGVCGVSTPYTIELFVEPAHPWVFGVRNYKAGEPGMFCPV